MSWRGVVLVWRILCFEEVWSWRFYLRVSRVGERTVSSGFGPGSGDGVSGFGALVDWK